VGQKDEDQAAEPKARPEPPSTDRFVATPGYDGRTSGEMKLCLTSQGNRVVLSGIGGDEVMGGVPTPISELQNHLVRARLGTLAILQRQLARAAAPFDPPFDKRYPFLDRDLLEFMFAIPREQLVRPTQRRSLMRRALVGIVPDEILNRKTKAFVSRAPLVGI